MMQEAQETGDDETIDKLLPLLGRSFSRFRHYNPKPSTVFREVGIRDTVWIRD